MQPLDIDFSSSFSSFVVLQLKGSLEIFQRVLETEYILCSGLVTMLMV